MAAWDSIPTSLVDVSQVVLPNGKSWNDVTDPTAAMLRKYSIQAMAAQISRKDRLDLVVKKMVDQAVFQ